MGSKPFSYKLGRHQPFPWAKLVKSHFFSLDCQSKLTQTLKFKEAVFPSSCVLLGQKAEKRDSGARNLTHVTWIKPTLCQPAAESEKWAEPGLGTADGAVARQTRNLFLLTLWPNLGVRKSYVMAVYYNIIFFLFLPVASPSWVFPSLVLWARRLS